MTGALVALLLAGQLAEPAPAVELQPGPAAAGDAAAVPAAPEPVAAERSQVQPTEPVVQAPPVPAVQVEPPPTQPAETRRPASPWRLFQLGLGGGRSRIDLVGLPVHANATSATLTYLPSRRMVALGARGRFEHLWGRTPAGLYTDRLQIGMEAILDVGPLRLGVGALALVEALKKRTDGGTSSAWYPIPVATIGTRIPVVLPVEPYFELEATYRATTWTVGLRFGGT